MLVGQTVTLRYDPQAPPSRPIEVVHDGHSAGLATRLDAYANTAVKRHRPSSQLTCDRLPTRTLPLAPGDAKTQGEQVMYLRHFALTRLPFETPAHTDELYESNSRRGPRHGSTTSSNSRASGCSQARSVQAKPPCADTSPPPCIPACIGWATSP